ncbi:MAG: hypothetical protein CMP30_01425, partial [Roseibacillus sp.]|nr:hypothetical protein [Roseibacillus sp.]
GPQSGIRVYIFLVPSLLRVERYGAEGDDKESKELLHGEFLPPLRRRGQAREPYGAKSPSECWATAGKKSKLLEIHDDLKLVMSSYLTEVVRKLLQ